MTAVVQHILFLARKDMFRDKRIVLFVVFVLAFSFVNLTFFASFLEGLSNMFQDEIINTETGHIRIEPKKGENNQYLKGEEEIRKKIEAIPGVVGAASHLNLPATAVFEDEQIAIPIVAIKPHDERIVTTIQEQILSGSYLSDDDTDEILIGKELAEDPLQQAQSMVGRRGLGVSAGEFINVTFFNGVTRTYHVKAIVGKDGPGAVQRNAYITRNEGESVLGEKGLANEILIRVPHARDADVYRARVLEAGVPGDVKTWSEASNFARVIDMTFGIVIYITTTVGLLIAIITVGIVTYINTHRKRRHIATLKTIGAQQQTILGIFVMESAIYGVFGVLLGIAFINLIIRYLRENPVHVPMGLLRPEVTPDILISATAMLLLASLAAGFLPAYLAARQPLLKNLRVE